MNVCMEDYRSYMDRVSVDEALHRKITERMAQTLEGTQTVQKPQTAHMPQAPVRRLLGVGRYVAVLACTAVIALGIWIAPRLANSPHIAVPPIALVFNRVEGDLSSSNRYIPGYFTQELSEEDVTALFGDACGQLNKDYEMTAEAGFSGEGELLQVTVAFEGRMTGRVVNVVMANGAVPVDFSYPEVVEVTDVNGTAVTAGFWESPADTRPPLHYATFALGETGYYVESAGDESARDDIAAFVAMVLRSGAADLSRVTPTHIPEWREDELTFAEALADPDFGAYVPDESPNGFAFELGKRVLNQRQDLLRIVWCSGLKDVTWTVRRLEQGDADRVVDVNVHETYDLGLYPIPRTESVPGELREIVDNPIVRAEDLTIDFVRARSYTVNDTGDDNTGYRMRFSVLYGNVLVEFSAKGVTPDAAYQMLRRLTA